MRTRGVTTLLLLLCAASVLAQGTTYESIRLENERASLAQLTKQLLASEQFFDGGDLHRFVFATVTHRVRTVSDEHRAALSLWKGMVADGGRIVESRDEVEVTQGGLSLWMPIDRRVKSILFERSVAGQGVYLLIRPVGRKGDDAVFFIEHVVTLEERGMDRVYGDAVYCAGALKNTDESASVLESVRKQWSGNSAWNAGKHAAAESFVRGMVAWNSGEADRAEEQWASARSFMQSNPDDALSQKLQITFQSIAEGRAR